MNYKRLLWTALLLLVVLTPLTSAATPVIGDGICRTDLGENRLNSPQDCKPSINDYVQCYANKETCLDLQTWREVNTFLLVIIALLTLILFLRNND